MTAGSGVWDWRRALSSNRPCSKSIRVPTWQYVPFPTSAGIGGRVAGWREWRGSWELLGGIGVESNFSKTSIILVEFCDGWIIFVEFCDGAEIGSPCELIVLEIFCVVVELLVVGVVSILAVVVVLVVVLEDNVAVLLLMSVGVVIVAKLCFNP